jgi:hypothetical protein
LCDPLSRRREEGRRGHGPKSVAESESDDVLSARPQALDWVMRGLLGSKGQGWKSLAEFEKRPQALDQALRCALAPEGGSRCHCPHASATKFN